MFVDNMISYSTSYVNNVYYTQAINVGKVSNNGWEFSSSYRLQNFTITGNYSIMQSYIKDTTGLSQDLTFASKVPGDRMINLPRHTAGLSLSYTFPKLFGKSDNATITMGMSEVDGVLSTDFVRWYTDIAYDRAPFDFSQEAQDKYAITSPSVIKFNLNIDYHISKNLNIFIQSNNFTNNYKSQFPSYATYGIR
jgi:outer membrane receptor protein involved in Fe transport